jgi:hypothetical protein
MKAAAADRGKSNRLFKCPVFRIDLKGRFVNVDDLTEKLFGYPREELFGRNLGDFLDEESNEALESIITRGRHFETSYESVDLKLSNFNDEWNDVSAIVSLNFLGGNPANYQVVITTPVTAIRESPFSESDFSTLDDITSFISEVAGVRDWNALAGKVCRYLDVEQIGFYLLDEGVPGIAAQGVKDDGNQLVDLSIAASIDTERLLRGLPYSTEDSPDSLEGNPIEYVYPLIVDDILWGAARVVCNRLDGTKKKSLALHLNILGVLMHCGIRGTGDDNSGEMTTLNAVREVLASIGTTVLAYDRDGLLLKEEGRGEPAVPEWETADILGLYKGDHGEIPLSLHGSWTVTIEKNDGENQRVPVLSLLREGRLHWLLYLYSIPESLSDRFGYFLTRMGPLEDIDLFRGDSSLIESFAAGSQAIFEAICRDSVRLSVDSYRKLNDEGRQFLNSIQNNCRNFGDAIKRIKDLSNIRGLAEEYHDLDMARIIDTVFGGIPAANGNIEKRLDKPEMPVIYGPREKITAVIRSLIISLKNIGGAPDRLLLNVRYTSAERRHHLYFGLENGPVNLEISSNFALAAFTVITETGGQGARPGPELALVRELAKDLGGDLKINGDAGKIDNFALILPRHFWNAFYLPRRAGSAVRMMDDRFDISHRTHADS